jgi:uncharacterized membrane protein
MSDWYYAENNEQRGPVLESELKGLLATHKLPAETLVWKEGMANWTPATQVVSLSPLTSTAPAATAVASAATTPNPASVTPVTASDLIGTPESLEVDADDAEKNKIFGIIAYLGILWIVPFLVAKDSPFSKYHANQGLTLFVIEVVLWIGLWMLDIIFGFILPSGILGIFVFIFSLLWLPVFVLIVLGIINAAKGKCVPLPILGGVKLLK